MKEYTTLKTVLEVPRLRVELRQHSFRGKNFDEFLRIMEDLTKSIEDQLVDSGMKPKTDLNALIRRSADDSPSS